MMVQLPCAYPAPPSAARCDPSPARTSVEQFFDSWLAQAIDTDASAESPGRRIPQTQKEQISTAPEKRWLFQRPFLREIVIDTLHLSAFDAKYGLIDEVIMNFDPVAWMAETVAAASQNTALQDALGEVDKRRDMRNKHNLDTPSLFFHYMLVLDGIAHIVRKYDPPA